MFSILKHETKQSLKQLIIWSLAVGGMGLFCIVLYKSMESSIAEMGEMFAGLGAFSEAFGMDKLSIRTIKGYFATEVGTVHSLGSAMFRAAISTVILSKEEDGHTAEFMYTLPVSRVKTVRMKYLSVVVNIVMFTVVCGALYAVGLMMMKENDMWGDFVKFMLLQMFMNIEIASMGFVVSSLSRKNRIGIGIGTAMVMYFFDMLSRVVPDLADYTKITPFSYSNAADIFTNEGGMTAALIIGLILTFVCTAVSVMIYNKKDLAG